MKHNELIPNDLLNFLNSHHNINGTIPPTNSLHAYSELLCVQFPPYQVLDSHRNSSTTHITAKATEKE